MTLGLYVEVLIENGRQTGAKHIDPADFSLFTLLLTEGRSFTQKDHLATSIPSLWLLSSYLEVFFVRRFPLFSGYLMRMKTTRLIWRQSELLQAGSEEKQLKHQSSNRHFVFTS